MGKTRNNSCGGTYFIWKEKHVNYRNHFLCKIFFIMMSNTYTTLGLTSYKLSICKYPCRVPISVGSNKRIDTHAPASSRSILKGSSSLEFSTDSLILSWITVATEFIVLKVKWKME